jgi:hypothetical protein
MFYWSAAKRVGVTGIALALLWAFAFWAMVK